MNEEKRVEAASTKFEDGRSRAEMMMSWGARAKQTKESPIQIPPLKCATYPSEAKGTNEEDRGKAGPTKF